MGLGDILRSLAHKLQTLSQTCSSPELLGERPSLFGLDSEGTSIVTENTFLFYENQFSLTCYFDLVTGVFGPAQVRMELITWATKQERMSSEFVTRCYLI